MSSPNTIVLPDTSLCAIVRDEKMNPAGGIERFIRAHVPHVEEAVIVDTGSIDGTREILEDLSLEYPNMRVLDHKFENYAESRNFSLEQATLKYALVLDADELLTEETPTNDWERLNSVLSPKFFSPKPKSIYRFSFQHISPESDNADNSAHTSRLFSREFNILFEKIKFKENNAFCGEYLDCSQIGDLLNVTIKHFVPSNESSRLKMKDWYNQANPNVSPSSLAGFPMWKAYNPKRDNFK